MTLSNQKTPCIKCTKETGRRAGCHSSCEKYKVYRAALDERAEKIRIARERDYGFVCTRKTKPMRMKGSKHGEV